MSHIPPELRDYLLAPSLRPLWPGLRDRLERTGHAVRGTIAVPLDEDGADRLSGLLGRAVPAGLARVRLADLDTSLQGSAAGRGLVAVVADLTGAPLRNRPAERDAAQAGRQRSLAYFQADAGKSGLLAWTDISSPAAGMRNRGKTAGLGADFSSYPVGWSIWCGRNAAAPMFNCAAWPVEQREGIP